MNQTKRCRCGEPLPPQTGKSKPRMCAECQRAAWRQRARAKAEKKGRKPQPRATPITGDKSLVIDFELGIVTQRYALSDLHLNSPAKIADLLATYRKRGYEVRQIGAQKGEQDVTPMD